MPVQIIPPAVDADTLGGLEDAVPLDKTLDNQSVKWVNY